MSKTKLAGLALAAATLIGACSTATPYQAVQPGSSYSMARGYSDQRIESNRYRIKFRGNSMTSRDTVEDYLLYRAAELSLMNGYDWFTLSSRNTREDKSTTTTYRDPFGPGFYSGFSWRYHNSGRWGGWGAWQETEDTRISYEASAEVLLGKGQKPSNDPNAYDAREVKQNLDPRIVRPQPRS
jgi:hypothetical protein